MSQTLRARLSVFQVIRYFLFLTAHRKGVDFRNTELR